MKLTRLAGMTRQSSCPQDAHGLAREGRVVSVLPRLAHLLHGTPRPGCPFGGRTEQEGGGRTLLHWDDSTRGCGWSAACEPSLPCPGLGPPARVGKASTPPTRVWRRQGGTNLALTGCCAGGPTWLLWFNLLFVLN